MGDLQKLLKNILVKMYATIEHIQNLNTFSSKENAKHTSSRRDNMRV